MEVNFMPTKEEDMARLLGMYRDSAYASMFRHFPEDCSEETLKAMFMAAGTLMRIEKDGSLVGFFYAVPSVKTKIADIAVVVLKEHQRQHIAETAIRKFVELAFTEGKLSRVICHVTDPHLIQALKQGGFMEECRMYKNAFYNNKLWTESRMVLTREFYLKVIHKEH